ncbi:hypothetical protein [Pseudarthrobacter sp. NIBRBAC000502771]|uniref:hypothetical protein n=1 Tax=Pseudarthrobacter sp. NIBRBAC000502771 TaxID=2590774 RepID=UPI00113170FD|nr:hypothetical protein [Pseudarthrobacter sp. NIBRBAC000502771]QDG62321.1 hypothetical protein NIBR502771_08305 [Pseudarthrobacter sp. NIBRBAC000502771]
MYQQENQPTPAAPSAGVAAQEFYLPLGGGVDPDLYLPEDRLRLTGRLSRWVQSLRTPPVEARKAVPKPE